MPVVERERRGHVEILTINRPEARNAIDGEVTSLLGGAFDELEEDGDAWVVILTGAGDKSFSAGMDLKAFARGEGGAIIGAKGGFAGIIQRDFPKPLIAAVNGTALGGGCEIALACDLVVAAEHATFGVPEVKRGLFPGAGGLLRLQRRIPLTFALEMALTGEPVSAERAQGLGLVNRVVPAESLIDEALSLAEKIAENAPLAVRWSKKIMRDSIYLTEDQGWTLNAEGVGIVFTSQDAMEGPKAFAEKRKPNWQGK